MPPSVLNVRRKPTRLEGIEANSSRTLGDLKSPELRTIRWLVASLRGAKVRQTSAAMSDGSLMARDFLIPICFTTLEVRLHRAPNGQVLLFSWISLFAALEKVAQHFQHSNTPDD